jgi:hypothetical protein
MKRLLLAGIAGIAFCAAAGAAFADEAAAKKWIDSEFTPSVLSKDDQLKEMQWFIKAAEPYKGMEINVLSEGIPTHTYESTVLAKAFEEITGIKVNHQILGEGEVVQAVQTQMQTNRNLYDGYINDSDLIGTHSRLQSAINAELQRQGLRLSEQSPGRFEVSYHIGVIRKKTTEINRDMPMMSPMVRCGVRTCWNSLSWGYMGPPLETVREYEYREGSLIIDVRESDSGRLAWRGVYRDTLRNAGPITDETIGKIVTQTLKGLVQ